MFPSSAISPGFVLMICGTVLQRFSFNGKMSASFEGCIFSIPLPLINGANISSNPPKCLAKALRHDLWVMPLNGAMSNLILLLQGIDLEWFINEIDDGGMCSYWPLIFSLILLPTPYTLHKTTSYFSTEQSIT